MMVRIDCYILEEALRLLRLFKALSISDFYALPALALEKPFCSRCILIFSSQV
jgi:hypothetical protein